jgi:uncharacterized Ntn-hydrolase superfamily protein
MPVAVGAMVLTVFGFATSAGATWSIVAVDDDTGEVGVAMAACGPVAALGEADRTLDPIVLVPGRGAGVLQGTVRPAAIGEMEALLSAPGAVGTASGADVVAVLLAAEDDPTLVSVRQYGVVLLGDRSDSAGLHLGDDSADAAAGLAADGVTVLGVGLVDRAVAERSLAAYTASRLQGESLASALVSAVEAGSAAGGDADCGSQTALFAQLAVAHPADEDGRVPSTLLTVTVDEDDGQNPVSLLAEGYQRGDRGWINAGRRSPTLIPRWTVLLVGLALALASVVVIRRGMRMG